MPDGNGMLFGFVALVMLMGALNYGINPAFAFAALFAGIIFVSILHTYQNMLGIQVTAGHTNPVFASSEARFQIRLSVADGRSRYALSITEKNGGKSSPLCDIPAYGDVRVDLSIMATRRGRLEPGTFTLFTRYPLGLIISWAHIELATHCVVYPQPEAMQTLPVFIKQPIRSGYMDGQSGDDFMGLRAYQFGDSPRRIHWKTTARSGSPVTKQFGGDAPGEIWIAWDMIPNLDVEARLSRLCRWVLEAERHNLVYGLRLPHQEIPPNRGERHQHQCLEALALFEP